MSDVAENPDSAGEEAAPESSEASLSKLSSMDLVHNFTTERIKFILQQIDSVNTNVYRFLGIYQTLMVALIGGQISLFVGHRQWGMSAATTRGGIIAVLLLETLVSCFGLLMIVIGVFAWIDYRNEECDLMDSVVGVGFRARPNSRNLWRWYETYIAAFIFVSIVVIWLLSMLWMFPNIH